jgi:peptide/nickel transport system permease protein
MAAYLFRRVLAAISIVLISATLLFVALRIVADPATALATGGETTTAHLEAIRARLGVDKPIPVQYALFMRGLFTGQMSRSYQFAQPANELVMERIPATLTLTGAGMLVALLLAFPLGMLAAIYRGTIFDYAVSFLSFLGFATPTFWLGTMLVLIFAVKLRLLPTSGSGTFNQLILPAITLAMWPMGQLTRIIRSEMLEVLGEDYIRTARAKGLRERAVMIRHAMRNALLPTVTQLGLLVGSLLSGAAITETIFAWPGMGRLALQASLSRDFPVIEASVLLIAIIFAGMNLLVDILYTLIDPRIRYG